VVQFHSPISGGVRRFVEDKCRYFARVPEVRHAVIVPGAEDREETFGRSTVFTVKSPRLVGSASYRVLYHQGRIRDCLARFRPQVIEVGDPYLTAWIGRRLAPCWGAKLVGFYHSDYPRAWYRSVQKFAGAPAGALFERWVRAYLIRLYRGMDALVVGSAALERLWSSQGLPDVRLIPLGVDTDVFRPAEDGAEARARTRVEWGVPADAPVALFVGRIAREKRLDWLRERLPDWRRAHPGLHLVLVGDGEWRERVRVWEREEPGLRWRPYIRGTAALVETYRAADVFVHAGLGETFGLSLLEAQACGLPVIASRDSGLDETLLPLAPSVLVPAWEAEPWVRAMAAALAGAGDVEARRRRHARVVETFPWWNTYDRLLRLYRELARRGSAPEVRV
jgi:alpha-1,6-mannosyltransferase